MVLASFHPNNDAFFSIEVPLMEEEVGQIFQVLQQDLK